MRFIDEAIVTVRSGKGGNGCISFRREKYVEFGGPNGGNGGKGGDVYIQGNKNIHSLQDIRLQHIYEAESGKPGQGNQCDGRKGKDYILQVPLGTMVFDCTGTKEIFLYDITEADSSFLLAQGGRGGKGNEHFKTSTLRTPRFAQKGEPGEEKKIRLELKILADVGIVGFPNAGKSTLISVLSAAKPTIAPYPFTTITPNLGVMIDTYDPERRIIVADIPGLIEGASSGIGLGHTFLKHIERTRFLIHLLSVEDMNDEDPFLGFRLVDEEIRLFNIHLSQRKQIKVVNKIDLLSKTELSSLKQQAHREGLELFFISSVTHEGIADLVSTLWNLYDSLTIHSPDISYKEVSKKPHIDDNCNIEVIWTKE